MDIARWKKEFDENKTDMGLVSVFATELKCSCVVDMAALCAASLKPWNKLKSEAVAETREEIRKAS